MADKLLYSFVNGKFKDSVSLLNRSFVFGDGIFETCKVENGKILYWNYHLKRLEKGIEILKLNLDFNKLKTEINKALTYISKQKNFIFKLIISRGESLRGYKFNANIQAIRIILISLAPPIINNNILLNFCQTGYAKNPRLAGIKHQNRLEQILASNHQGDCIMLDENNYIISTTYSNIFIIKNQKIYTPNLDNCGILGTRRQLIIDNFDVIIKRISKDFIKNADEVFISNSLIGIQSIKELSNIIYENKITQKIKNKLSL